MHEWDDNYIFTRAAQGSRGELGQVLCSIDASSLPQVLSLSSSNSCQPTLQPMWHGKDLPKGHLHDDLAPGHYWHKQHRVFCRRHLFLSQYWESAPVPASCPKSVITAHTDATRQEWECEIKISVVSSLQERNFSPNNFQSLDSDSQSLKYSTGTRNNLYASPIFREME